MQMQLSCNWIAPLLACLLGAPGLSRAQESPFFVTYTHHMQEPGNLELEGSSTAGVAGSGGRSFFAPYLELEYGVTARWTSELYLEGVEDGGGAMIFTGWRFENRYKPLRREHWINPILYLEYASVNEASRILKDFEGHAPDFSSPARLLGRSHDRELEAKLILSSDRHDWNLSENFLIAKNFSRAEGFEFGYAAGVYHPLARLASGANCRLCRENFTAGAELYGGLGSTLGFGLADTAHYIAPVVAWAIADNATLRFSSGFGLTRQSSPVLFRLGYTYEIQGFGGKLSRLLAGKPR
jgi:hypothetical protein